MKKLFISGLLLILFGWPRIFFGQGSLAPPGPPGPTMKSLDQVQPRTPISSAPYTISAPGSYYLTQNLTVSSGDAIIIATGNVLLDLNGFTLSTTSSSISGSGVNVTGAFSNIEIRNGFIQGSITFSQNRYSGGGFMYGINATNTINSRAYAISVSGCQNGIFFGNFGSIECCTARNDSAQGLNAMVVRGSAGASCGNFAIFGVGAVQSCEGGSPFGNGVLSFGAISNSVGTSDTSTGLAGLNGHEVLGSFGSSASTVNQAGLFGDSVFNSYGTSTSSIGLSANTATGSYGTSTSNIGLSVNVAKSCYGISTSDIGLQANVAVNSYASSSSQDGMVVQAAAANCFAKTSQGVHGMNTQTAENCVAQNPNDIGLLALNATNCYATGSVTGISATTALSCSGSATTGAGISVTASVTNSSGSSGGHGAGIVSNNIALASEGTSSQGTGLSAFIANSCEGVGSPAVSANNKYDMP